jgi:hypothetical protein
MTDVIELWHQRARPLPTERDFDVQLGCHLEEIVEMFQTLDFECDGTTFEATVLEAAINDLATALKTGEVKARIVDRKEFLDSLGDQVVTAVGAGHCANMKITEAVRRVNASNWSKFNVDGQPIRNDHGKITKGPNYAPPNLEGLY